MTVRAVLDAAGRRRSPATMPGYDAGRPPRNKGQLYPADPPMVEEIIAVMRQTRDDRHGARLRALIVVLWRGGLRVQEALALGERDLDPGRGSLLVRRGKGSRRREIGMDACGWEQLRPWLAARLELPVGPLFCVIDGPTRGRPWSSANVRVEFRRFAAQAGIRRRIAPHQLRHTHAVELARQGVALNVIQRQLGHANLGTTSIYLRPRNPYDGSSRPAAPLDVRRRVAPAVRWARVGTWIVPFSTTEKGCSENAGRATGRDSGRRGGTRAGARRVSRELDRRRGLPSDAGSDSPYRYDRFAALAGDLAPVSEKAAPYRVSTKRLQGHRPVRTLFMALAALTCQVLFMVWLFQLGHLPAVNESPALHVASLAMVVSIFGIQFFLLVNVATLIVATVTARDPVPVEPLAGTRVAFLTTIVPSKEPIEGVRRTLAAARAIRHDGTLDVWLLDEGDDRFVRRVCRDLGVRHFSRKGVEEWNRSTGAHKARTKHGNYNAWLAAHGEHYDYLVSVDPDHVPLPEFCERMLGYFRDPDIAFVVGPQVYGNFDNFVTKAAESQQYLFHSLLQRAGNYFGAPMLVGTNNAIRIAALRSVGGMQDSITEDMATSLAVHAGRNAVTGSRWRSVYTPDVLAVGEGPSSWTDYFSQQLRWSRGTDEVLLRTFWRFGRRLRPGQFLHYTLLVSYYPTMGFAWMLGALNSFLYLVLGAGGLTVDADAWLMLYAYSAVFQVVLYRWNRRHNVSPHEKEGSSGALGMLISMLSAPLYAHSLTSTLLRRESSFVVTPKGDSISPDRCATFRWHGLWGGFLAACLAASAVLGNGEPAMRAWTALALSICVLPLVIWQAQSIFGGLQSRNRALRTDYSTIDAERLTGVAHETAA